MSIDVHLQSLQNLPNFNLRLFAFYPSLQPLFLSRPPHQLVYRRYAGLFFTLCVEQGDNGLAYLETIHLFVEMLDLFFGNVCELDLVFNFHKVYVIVDEFFLAGEVQETSKKVMLDRLQFLEKIE